MKTTIQAQTSDAATTFSLHDGEDFVLSVDFASDGVLVSFKDGADAQGQHIYSDPHFAAQGVATIRELTSNQAMARVATAGLGLLSSFT